MPDEPLSTEEALEPDKRDRLIQALAAAASIAALSAVGAFVFFVLGYSPLATLAPVAGIAAAVTCRRYLEAGLAAAIGVLAGGLLTSLVLRIETVGLLAWIVPLSQIAALAAAVACALVWVLANSARLERILLALGVTIVILAGWSTALAGASQPKPSADVLGRPTPAVTFSALLTMTPDLTTETGDQSTYMVMLSRMREGEGYYRALVTALDLNNKAHPTSQVWLDAPLTYRPPTIFWLMSRLPNNGISIILMALLFQAAGVTAAYLLARRFVSAAVALVGCAAVATYGAALTPTLSILVTEYWAGLLGLVSLAILVQAQPQEPRKRMLLNAAAVAAAIGAALIGELSAPFLVVGLVTVLADADDRRERLWIWWLAAIVGIVAFYFLHWNAAIGTWRELGFSDGHAAGSKPFPYWSPDGLGVLASVGLLSLRLRLTMAVSAVLYSAGLIGALMVPSRRERVALAVATLGGTAILMLVTAPEATAPGKLPTGYWGMIILPAVLACVPLVVSRIRAVRAAERLPG